MTIGMALPSDALTKDATEFIGLLVCLRDREENPKENIG